MSNLCDRDRGDTENCATAQPADVVLLLARSEKHNFNHLIFKFNMYIFVYIILLAYIVSGHSN